jgi:hypothetical protein
MMRARTAGNPPGGPQRDGKNRRLRVQSALGLHPHTVTFGSLGGMVQSFKRIAPHEAKLGLDFFNEFKPDFDAFDITAHAIQTARD